MPLTATGVSQAKQKTTAYKLTDGHGQYLLVKRNGGKY